MIVLKRIFHEVGPKTKSRRKVVYDIKKVEKHCTRQVKTQFDDFLEEIQARRFYSEVFCRISCGFPHGTTSDET